MTEHSKYNNDFKAEDIERYYNGKMSSQEMHRLEKAALEDPFLADALEGYTYTTTPVQDIEQLQAGLQSKLEGGKVVPVRNFNKNQFLRIAALFILLAGCGWAVYQFGFNQNATDKVALEKTEVATPSIAADSNTADAALQQSTANTEANAQTTTTQTDGRGTVTLSTQNRHTGKLNSSSTVNQKEKAENAKLGNIEAEMSRSANDEASVTTDLAKRRINSGAPAMDSAPQQDLAKGKTYNYSSGNIASAPRQDSVVIAGYGAQRKQTVGAVKENIIVLQRRKDDSMQMQEVVVVSNGRRNDSTYRKPRISFEETEPENGTAYYDDYVINNLQMPEAELQKNISGEVKLSFEINDAGEAVNIIVEKSLCAECDKEAIRLLKEGPKFKKNKDKKGKLSIKF